MLRVRTVLLMLALGCAMTAQAKDLRWPEPSHTGFGIDPTSPLAPSWTAWGGRATVRFNADILQPLGLELSPLGGGELKAGVLRLSVHEHGGLAFRVGGTQFQGFVDGSLQLSGGLRLAVDGRKLDLQDLRLQPRAGNEWEVELVDSEGTVWFVNDHIHYQLAPDRTEIEIFNMDLRVAPALAQWIGNPLMEMQTIGVMAVSSQVRVSGDWRGALKSCAAPNWPGSSNGGINYQADVTLMDLPSVGFMRCNNCSGAAGATNGSIVFAPNARLKNSDLNSTAEIPWYGKFSGYRPPYNNDQHPFLIWNLYRVNQDGSIDQIGRSGVKHAFFSTNTNCVDNTCSSVSGAILGRACEDLYSTSNNDQTNALGPRHEIVPAKGIWGRCGSIYDPDCDHNQNSASTDQFRDRMIVGENQIRSGPNPGAIYMMESWYIVRDDINIYNTMGYRRVAPTFSSVWQLLNVSGQPFTVGPVLNNWVNPANPGANAANVEIDTPEGKVRVAVRATDLGNNRWRYDYAVMNFDFAREQMEQVAVPGNPAAEVYRVHRAFGFDSVQLPVPGSDPVPRSFSDGDQNAGNEWSSTRHSGSVRFTAPAGNALNWGTMFRFRIEADGAPVPQEISLRVLDAGTPDSYRARVIGPPTSSDALMSDGLE